MKTELITFLLAVTCGLAASAPDEPTPRRADYSAFGLVNERNIFNSSRSRRSANVTETKEVRVDSFSLVGTLTYAKGLYAFFDGSSPEYRKTVEPGKPIADFTVAEIQGESVKLTAGTNTMELQVGMQVRREDGGEWKQSRGSSVPSISDSTSAESPVSDDSDIVKRLMKQREQELK